MEKLFTGGSSDSGKQYIVYWDKEKIDQFLKVRNLEGVRISFHQYRRTLIGFLKLLFFRLRLAEGINVKRGEYDQWSNSIKIFYDIIIADALIAAEREKKPWLKAIQRDLAHTLGHELGHAQKGVPVWYNGWQTTALSEKEADEFACNNIEELAAAFFVEEINL